MLHGAQTGEPHDECVSRLSICDSGAVPFGRQRDVEYAERRMYYSIRDEGVVADPSLYSCRGDADARAECVDRRNAANI